MLGNDYVDDKVSSLYFIDSLSMLSSTLKSVGRLALSLADD